MARVALSSALVVFGQFSASPVRASGGTPQAVDGAVGYTGFMKLTPEERRERLARMRAEDRALIVRTHAERWLAANRARLSSPEIAVFDEMIAFIRPELYAPRRDQAIDDEERALRTRMRCRVSPDDVRAAFMVVDASPQVPVATPTWTFLDQASCWLEWAAERLTPYVPD